MTVHLRALLSISWSRSLFNGGLCGTGRFLTLVSPAISIQLGASAQAHDSEDERKPEQAERQRSGHVRPEDHVNGRWSNRPQECDIGDLQHD